MSFENIFRTVVYHFMVNSGRCEVDFSQSTRDDSANTNDKTTLSSWNRPQIQMDFESLRLTDINACPESGLEYV